MDYTITPQQKQQYHDEGYFILRGVIPSEQIVALKQGINDLMDASLDGKAPEIRWISKEKRIPGRFGQMLRPELLQPAFVDSIVNGPYIPVAEQILGGPIRYSLFGMLAGGDGEPYVQAWHRDLAPIEGERQMPILKTGYPLFVQTNGPLFEDRFLTIVPGSHLRPTTREELNAFHTNPVGDMPGQITVETQPGDVAFYYPNLWHRGFNPAGELRWTMHHAFWLAAAPVHVHEGGQKEWIETSGYLETLPPALAEFLQRYVDAYPTGDLPDLRTL